jgi:hypothetical protein
MNLPPHFFQSPNVTQPEYKRQPTVPEGLRQEQLSKIKPEKYTPPRNYKWTHADKVIGNTQEVSLFSQLFFSNKNIKEIQRLLRYNVYIASDKRYVISPQEQQAVLIIMRSQYLSYANHPQHIKDYKKEIMRLNSIVVTAMLPDLISNIEQYVGYIKDSTEIAAPNERGINTSVTGERTNRSVTDVLIGDDVFFNS